MRERLVRETWVEALSDEQAEYNMAKALLVFRLKLEETDAHRLLPRRTDHGCFDRNSFFIRCRGDHEFKIGPAGKRLGGFNRAAAHGNLRNPMDRPLGILCEDFSVKRCGQAFVLPAIHGLRGVE